MTTAQVIVTLLGVVLSGFIAWFFWFAPKGQTAPRLARVASKRLPSP